MPHSLPVPSNPLTPAQIEQKIKQITWLQRFFMFGPLLVTQVAFLYTWWPGGPTVDSYFQLVCVSAFIWVVAAIIHVKFGMWRDTYFPADHGCSDLDARDPELKQYVAQILEMGRGLTAGEVTDWKEYLLQKFMRAECQKFYDKVSSVEQ